MTAEGETDQNALLRNLLETLAGEEIPRAAANSENVAQLLAAAIAQVGQSILHGHGAQAAENSDGGGRGGGGEGGEEEGVIDAGASSGENFPVNPQAAEVYEGLETAQECSTFSFQEDPDVVSTVEIPTTEKPRPLCIKFPIELRKRIIAMRKEGKKSKDIAKELKVSVSGVQKVWERFLATGMVHDRKPSTYAGRPRKSTYSQESSFSPGFDLSEDVFPSSASRIEYVTTPISAPPPDTPTSAVIITEDNEVFTEGALDMPGATVEIVETSPMVPPKPKSAKKKGMPAYREELLLRLVEDCPLATMRAQTDGATNPHVQNLMTSITRPLYLEYVLGHPFGKVPPPRPFEGCTSEEAQIILSDPSNPVGKQLLADAQLKGCVKAVSRRLQDVTLNDSEPRGGAPTPNRDMSSSTKTHRSFVSEPMEGKPVTAVPGIGDALGRRLKDKGYYQAKDLLDEFLKLEKNKEKFMSWLGKICSANKRHQKDCYESLKDWCDQYLPTQY